jgi:hypothetical protein
LRANSYIPTAVAWPILFKGLAVESGREAVDILAVEVEAERVATWR